MAGLDAPPGYVRLSAQFVIEDGIDTKVIALEAAVDPHIFDKHLVDACHQIGRKILKGAVSQTNMLAQLTTHPEDLEYCDE